MANNNSNNNNHLSQASVVDVCDVSQNAISNSIENATTNSMQPTAALLDYRTATRRIDESASCCLQTANDGSSSSSSWKRRRIEINGVNADGPNKTVHVVAAPPPGNTDNARYGDLYCSATKQQMHAQQNSYDDSANRSMHLDAADRHLLSSSSSTHTSAEQQFQLHCQTAWPSALVPFHDADGSLQYYNITPTHAQCSPPALLPTQQQQIYDQQQLLEREQQQQPRGEFLVQRNFYHSAWPQLAPYWYAAQQQQQQQQYLNPPENLSYTIQHQQQQPLMLAAPLGALVNVDNFNHQLQQLQEEQQCNVNQIKKEDTVPTQWNRMDQSQINYLLPPAHVDISPLRASKNSTKRLAASSSLTLSSSTCSSTPPSSCGMSTCMPPKCSNNPASDSLLSTTFLPPPSLSGTAATMFGMQQFVMLPNANNNNINSNGAYVPATQAVVEPALLARAVQDYLAYCSSTSTKAQAPFGAAECCVTIRYATVAQKSYGSEKRFICPPPLVKLTGPGWHAILREMKRSTNMTTSTPLNVVPDGGDVKNITQPKIDIDATDVEPILHQNQTSHQPANALVTMPVNGFIRLNFSETDVHLLEFVVCQSSSSSSRASLDDDVVMFGPPSRHHCMAKQLHISDTFKGKAFSFHFNLVLPNITIRLHSTHNNSSSESQQQQQPFFSLGVFQSDMVRVISKPSKKKATSSSTRNSELCVLSGSQIALFNRLRSQTSSTRFLHVEEGHHQRQLIENSPIDNFSFYSNTSAYEARRFSASLSQWGAFYIYLIGKRPLQQHDDPMPELLCSDGFIHYGQSVKLVCARTGLALPPLIVYKIDKNLIDLDSVELVSQLHKCAFHVEATNNMYLNITQDEITVCMAEPHSPYTPSKLRIREGCGWTIINVEEKQYNFVLPPAWLVAATTSNPQQSDTIPLLRAVTPMPFVKCIRAHAATGGIPSSSSAQQHLCVTFELVGEGLTSNYQVFFGPIKMDTVVRCDEMMHCHFPSLVAVQCALARAHQQEQNDSTLSNAFHLRTLLVRADGVIYPTAFSVDLRQVLSPSFPTGLTTTLATEESCSLMNAGQQQLSTLTKMTSSTGECFS